MTNRFFHLSRLQFLCWMADKVFGLCDSSGRAKLNSVCFLWQESVRAVRWYAMLISYGRLKKKKSLCSASSKGLAITTRPKCQYFLIFSILSIFLFFNLSPNLRKQQGGFGKIRQLIQELWLGTVPWKGVQLASPECVIHKQCRNSEQMKKMQMYLINDMR